MDDTGVSSLLFMLPSDYSDIVTFFQGSPRPSNREQPNRLLSPLRLDEETSRWEKALWKRHPDFEDNYVPADFLASTKIKFDSERFIPLLFSPYPQHCYGGK
jgi:hypothetical protein